MIEQINEISAFLYGLDLSTPTIFVNFLSHTLIFSGGEPFFHSISVVGVVELFNDIPDIVHRNQCLLSCFDIIVLRPPYGKSVRLTPRLFAGKVFVLKIECFLCYFSIILHLALAVKAFFLLQLGSVREKIFCKAGVSRLICGFDVQLLCGPQCFACALTADRLTDVDKLIEDLTRQRSILVDELIKATSLPTLLFTHFPIADDSRVQDELYLKTAFRSVYSA